MSRGLHCYLGQRDLVLRRGRLGLLDVALPTRDLLRLLERQMILVSLSRLRPLQEVQLQMIVVLCLSSDFARVHIEVLEKRLQ